MCCIRFPISAFYRKAVERHLQTAQHLGHLRQVKYLLAHVCQYPGSYSYALQPADRISPGCETRWQTGGILET